MKEVFEKIIKLLDERYFANRHTYHNDAWNVGIDQAINIVNRVANEYSNSEIQNKSDGKDTNVPSNDGWIPISSGNLPDERIDVLCCNDDGKIMVGHIYWDEDEQDFIAWGRIGAYNDWMPQVVAWMPIVPYKEGE